MMSDPNNKINKSVAAKTDILFTYAAYGISIVILVTLFVENFILSSGFNILRFREIDDVAFQDVLRRIHLAIETGQFRELIVINDYAYGWIFWFPLALITYPLYWISTHFAIDWPLIVAPRQLSLAFGIGTLFLMRKILKKYGMPEYVAAMGLLIFLLFPSFGYFSLRFGTVNEVMFFSALSLYFAVTDNPSTSRGRLFTVIALTLAGGVKLSGLFISPLIFALIVFRYEFKSFSVFARDLLLPTALFIVLLVAFSNPSLFLYKFHPEYVQEYIKTLSHFIEVTKIASDSLDPLERFYDTFFGSAKNVIYILILLFGLIMYAFKSKIHRFDTLASLGIFLIIVAYLFYSVKNKNSAAIYLTSVSFLLLFGLLFFGSLQRGKVILIAIIALELIDLTHRAQFQYKFISTQNQTVPTQSWNHLAYYVKNITSTHAIDESNRIAECMGIKDKNWEGHLFVDFTIPTGFNSLSYPKACISVAWNNLSTSGKYCAYRQIDYIIMDKLAPGSLPEDLFNAKVKMADPKIASDLLTDRESRKNITNGGYFDGRHFVKICDLDMTSVYSAEATPK